MFMKELMKKHNLSGIKYKTFSCTNATLFEPTIIKYAIFRYIDLSDILKKFRNNYN